MLLVAGCATMADLEPTADLQPAPAANEMARLEEAAVDRVKGVCIIAQAHQWPGPQPIRNEVTPVRVVIDHHSKMPLRLSYNEFALVAADGMRYAALPLYQIEGSVLEFVLVDDYTPIANPDFIYDSFTVAPLYGPIYPTLTTYPSVFAYDPFYYDSYSTYWVAIPLPTAEMFERALPEGVLEAGGHLEGYLYFERVPDEQSRVTFRADLVNAKNNHFFGEVRIPFLVQ
ncbi:hypothetical protein [Nitrosococcus wardiae]|uniref:Uncharacterized protein n=1 Tax=Nitrosococcus wardiae TaxID=1814290 RepID=A0A4P7BVH2_9GAMM|nr:hypothetical protein [Nitrosococcus wardiae]QBQ54018.1 hypothetical protein E3U44_05480 [Nitrosococcus wardiae]